MKYQLPAAVSLQLPAPLTHQSKEGSENELSSCNLLACVKEKKDFIKGFGRLQRLSFLQRINRKNTDTWKNVFYGVSNFDRKVAYYYGFINPVPQSNRLNVHSDPRSGRRVVARVGGVAEQRCIKPQRKQFKYHLCRLTVPVSAVMLPCV